MLVQEDVVVSEDHQDQRSMWVDTKSCVVEEFVLCLGKKEVGRKRARTWV